MHLRDRFASLGIIEQAHLIFVVLSRQGTHPDALAKTPETRLELTSTVSTAHARGQVRFASHLAA